MDKFHFVGMIPEAKESKEDYINRLIKSNELDTNKISDGFHTFEELYEHRVVLFIALCEEFNRRGFYMVWRSKKHSDGELAFGGTWFVLGINKDAGNQITYHLPISKWDETNFADTLEAAPEWDGHTSNDVLERLKQL